MNYTDDKQVISLPQKRYYRQRAHSNPIADHNFDNPPHPDLCKWNEFYPDYIEGDSKKQVVFADIGCGYGGFLVKLSEMYPDRLSLGMEIRVKVSDYVQDRIKALRFQNPGKYRNIACIRTNAMKHLPHYFHKRQLEKIFFLYPDPHFKKSKFKRRIINRELLSEYAYVLQEGGMLYTITDVQALHEWNVKHLEEHPSFQRLTKEEESQDPLTPQLYSTSEEGTKVKRNNGEHFLAIFRRI